MWFEQGVSSSAFIVEKTLYCVSGAYALGASPDVDTLLFTAAHFSLLTNGSWGWSLPFTPPPYSALQCLDKNRPDFLKTSCRFIAARLFSLPLCCIDFLLTKKRRKRQFSTPIKATITGLEYLSISFICSAARAVQPALKVNIFAWHSVRSNRKQRLRYFYTSKFVKMLHLRTLVRQSRSERFSLLGCQRQPCEQQAGSLKTDSLAAEDFTMPGFLNSSHPLWFPTFRIPIYPAALKKKKKSEAEVSSEIDEFQEVEDWPFFTVTPDTLF